MDAGRSDVRVAHAVTDAAERRDAALVVARCRGYDVRVDGGVGQVAEAAAPVAGADDDDDAPVPGDLDRLGQRVAQVADVRVGAEGQVEDSDVEASCRILRVLHDPVDAGDDLRYVGVAVRVGHLDAENPCVRGYPEEGRIGRPDGAGVDARVVAGDDPGQVRAVPEGVQVAGVRVLRLEGQVGAVDDLVGPVQALDRRNTRVDQGHVHTSARGRVAGGAPDPGSLCGGGQGVGGRVVAVGCQLHRAIGTDAGDPRQLAECGGAAGRQADLHDPYGRHRAHDGAAEADHGQLHGVEVGGVGPDQPGAVRGRAGGRAARGAAGRLSGGGVGGGAGGTDREGGQTGDDGTGEHAGPGRAAYRLGLRGPG